MAYCKVRKQLLQKKLHQKKLTKYTFQSWKPREDSLQMSLSSRLDTEAQFLKAWVSQITQQDKSLVTNSDDQSAIPNTDTVLWPPNAQM